MPEKLDFSKIEKLKYFEKPIEESKEEVISENKRLLQELEKSGEFVFHGSYQKLEILEPRQGRKRNKETGKIEEDGSPAVSATPFADIAIFRSNEESI